MLIDEVIKINKPKFNFEYVNNNLAGLMLGLIQKY